MAEDDAADVRAAATAALGEASDEPRAPATAKTSPAESEEQTARVGFPVKHPPSDTSHDVVWPTAHPLQAPNASVVTPTETGGVPPEVLAGFGIRAASALIDLSILFVLSAFLAGVVLGILDTITSTVTKTTTFTGWLLGFVVGSSYFTFLHGSVEGQTVGNKICKIRLIHGTRGGRVPYARAFLRWLMSLVSAVPFGIGYLWMLQNEKHQTWHDMVAVTTVVKTASYSPPQRPRVFRSRRT